MRGDKANKCETGQRKMRSGITTKEGETPTMYLSIKDGKVNTVESLPDLSDYKPFNGLHYCDRETTLPNGRKKLNWQKCDLFSDNEVSSLLTAASVLEHLFDNLNRLEAARDAYREFRLELDSLISNDQFAIATVDRRFRAYVFEWKLFIDHWKKYIDDGAQTKHWKDKSGAEKYIDAYQKLYRDVTTNAYDSCEEYVLATAIRNHVVHANNAVYASHVGPDGNGVFISRDQLLSESNISASQREVIERQDELIDLAVVAEKSLSAAEQIMEELLDFQIDLENTQAAYTLLKANERINAAGIKSDRWMIFQPDEVKWEPSLTQSVTMQRLKDEEGKPVNDPPITMPLMTPSVGLSYQYLNWQGYIAFAGYLKHLYESGKWQEIQDKYLAVDNACKGADQGNLSASHTRQNRKTQCGKQDPDRKPGEEERIEKELKATEDYQSSHPILNYSPGDLKREGRMVEEYLKQWSEADQGIWLEYYSEELPPRPPAPAPY